MVDTKRLRCFLYSRNKDDFCKENYTQLGFDNSIVVSLRFTIIKHFPVRWYGESLDYFMRINFWLLIMKSCVSIMSINAKLLFLALHISDSNIHYTHDRDFSCSDIPAENAQFLHSR